MWIYPVSENAAQALENPIYPSDYKDFIITFPDHPGVQPVYVVLSTQLEKNKARGREFEDEVYGDYSSTRSETGREVTVKTKSGTRTRIDMVGRALEFGTGMCGSESGSIPADVGQPMIRVSDMTVGGRK